MNKKDFQKYLKETERMLLDAGFNRTVESDRVSYEWKKETKYGLWFVNVDNDNKSGVLSIFTKFQDVKKAHELLLMSGGNLYSGKWNIHTTSVSDAKETLQWMIKRACDTHTASTIN